MTYFQCRCGEKWETDQPEGIELFLIHVRGSSYHRAAMRGDT